MDNPRNMACSILTSIEKDKKYSNSLLFDMAENGDLNERDKALSHIIVKTVLERKITIDYNISLYLKNPINKLKPEVIAILRIGACEILFLDKIPNSASVDECVKLSKKRGFSFASGLVNAVLRRISENGLKLPDNSDENFYLSVKYSIPKIYVEKFISYYGKNTTESILSHSNENSPIYLRKNTLKDFNVNSDFQKIPFPDGCYKAENRNFPKYVKEGLFHVEDISSQISVGVLAPKKGDTVLDICASPGGKSATIAEIMENDGLVISCDIYERKLKLIENLADNLGITIIKTRLRNGADKTSPLPPADKVLCDAPCSGFGVIGKKPEIKYKSYDEIKNLPGLQYSILENSAHFVKKGGVILYSTCTLLPSENIEIAKKFLNLNKNFKPVEIEGVKGFKDGETVTILPQSYDCDGFFMALFKRIF